MPGKMVWFDTLFNNAVASAGTLLVDLVGTPSDSSLRLAQMTLMRTIVRMDWAATVHDSGEGSTRLSWGLGIASRDAFNVGSTAVPLPNQTDDFPPRGWVCRSVHRIWAFAADDPSVDVTRVDVNLQSRRRLDNGVSYLIATNDAQEGTTVALTAVGIIRQLYLLT